ncbi:WhiB family transcriptional regulator [Rhodococcus jostii]|uniref:WhiB family transcriptional regulator n=1 Tax=Rhodococcus jostii TaxID=132919 RepID=UPI003652F1D9
MCSQCPVRQACRDHALTARELFGIWGGMSEEDRDRVFGRGRAGKSAAERSSRPPTSSVRLPRAWQRRTS